MGYGVIEKKQSEWAYVAHGLIETSSRQALSERLLALAEALESIVDRYHPDQATLEQLFFYKNVKTAIDVGQARGAALLTLRRANIPVTECTPLQVKQALTGYGRAEKKQIQVMLQLIFELPRGKIQDDAADALAIALTGARMAAMQRRQRSAG